MLIKEQKPNRMYPKKLRAEGEKLEIVGQWYRYYSKDYNPDWLVCFPHADIFWPLPPKIPVRTKLLCYMKKSYQQLEIVFPLDFSQKTDFSQPSTSPLAACARKGRVNRPRDDIEAQERSKQRAARPKPQN